MLNAGFSTGVVTSVKRRIGLRTGRVVLSALALAALLIVLMVNLAFAAKPRMVLGHSMLGVRIGDSLSRLHQILGEPRAVHHVNNEIAGDERIDVYGRLAFGSFPSSDGEAGIFYMQTTRRSIRTASGIGVGTRKHRLEREFPSLSCYGPICRVTVGGGVGTIGQRVTDFRMRNGRVRVVTIGRVID